MKFHLVQNVSSLAVASFFGAAAFSPVAFAQDGDEQKTLSKVTVTATKREATLQEVPVAVSVLSDELLNSTGTGSVEALADLTPSLTFNKGNNESNSSLSIRGLGTSVFSAAVEPSVSIVVDDVVMARSGQGFQDLIDVERIEVLRGPQSTLFGKNASAGVVSVVTQDPSDTFTGAIDGELAEEESAYVLRGTVSGPISDTVGFRLSGFSKDHAGHIRNVANGERVEGIESWGLRGKLQFEPNSDLELTLIGDYRDMEASPTLVIRDSENPAYREQLLPVIAGEENTSVNLGGNSFSESTQGGLSAHAEYTFDNDFTLTSVTAHRFWEFENNLEVDGLPNEDPLPGGLLTFDLNNGNTDLNQFSQEIRLASPDMGKFDFLVGAFAYVLDLDTDFQRRLEIATANGNIAQSAQFNGSVKTTNLAGFVSGNYYFTDNTSLFGGVRYLHEKIEWSAFRDPSQVLEPGDRPFGGALGTFADFDGSVDDSALVGNLGVRHSFTDNVNAYASYSRGYKGRAYTVAFATLPGAEPVEAEESDAFEAGLKLNTSDGRWAANFAAFHTKYQNFQAQAQRPGEITFELLNAGEVSTQGLEGEFIGRPTDLTDVSLGFAWIDAKIDEFPGGPCYLGQTAAQGCVNDAQDLAGGELPYSPDFRITFFGKQRVPLEGMPFDGFVQTSGYWQDDITFSIDQDPRAGEDARAIVNAAIGIEDKEGRYRASVFVNNLFDEYYVTSIAPFNLFGGVVYQNVPRDHQRYVGVRFGVEF